MACYGMAWPGLAWYCIAEQQLNTMEDGSYDGLDPIDHQLCPYSVSGFILIFAQNPGSDKGSLWDIEFTAGLS